MGDGGTARVDVFDAGSRGVARVDRRRGRGPRELDVGLIADDDDVMRADGDPPKAHVQRGGGRDPGGARDGGAEVDTIAAFVDGSRRSRIRGVVGDGAGASSPRGRRVRSNHRRAARRTSQAGAGLGLGAGSRREDGTAVDAARPAARAGGRRAPRPRRPRRRWTSSSRHLKLGRGRPAYKQVRATPRGLEGAVRRRRANPFASFAANDAKLAVDASQQMPGFAMLHSG